MVCVVAILILLSVCYLRKRAELLHVIYKQGQLSAKGFVSRNSCCYMSALLCMPHLGLQRHSTSNGVYSQNGHVILTFTFVCIFNHTSSWISGWQFKSVGQAVNAFVVIPPLLNLSSSSSFLYNEHAHRDTSFATDCRGYLQNLLLLREKKLQLI